MVAHVGGAQPDSVVDAGGQNLPARDGTEIGGVDNLGMHHGGQLHRAPRSLLPCQSYSSALGSLIFSYSSQEPRGTAEAFVAERRLLVVRSVGRKQGETTSTTHESCEI